MITAAAGPAGGLVVGSKVEQRRAGPSWLRRVTEDKKCGRKSGVKPRCIVGVRGTPLTTCGYGARGQGKLD